MVDVKEAVRIAAEYFSNLIDQSRYTNLLLEEVELSEDDRFWNVTLGYDPSQPVGPLGFSRARRTYKVFRIDAESGRVVSMKIRELTTADA